MVCDNLVNSFLLVFGSFMLCPSMPLGIGVFGSMAKQSQRSVNASVLSLSAAQYEPEVESLVPNAWRRWVQKKMAGLSQLAIVSTQLD